MSDTPKKSWIFGVVGNIVAEHTDENGNTYYGTKAFTPGTKVYLDGKDWDPENTEVAVIARNRFGRFVIDYVPIALIENIRPQRIFNPTVLEIVAHVHAVDGWEWWGRTAADRRETQAFVALFTSQEQE